MSGSDSSRARGFPAFPARRGGRVRGRSFWAKSWAGAVEDAWPEEGPLKEGRTLARSGRIGPVTLGPGRIAADVYGGEEAFTTVLTPQELDDNAWERLWEHCADRPAVTEALLAGEVPEELLEAAEDARVGLLPGYADLGAECDCDGLDHPCPHATALGYQVGWLLDEDPWLLLLLRGRDAESALEELKCAVLFQAMTGTAGDEDDEGPDDEDGTAGPEPGAGAGPDDRLWEANRQAYDRPAVPLPPLPPLPGPLQRSGAPVTGIGADPLEVLAADAAVRARELLAALLTSATEPPPPLNGWQDTVRLAATHPDPRVRARLRESCGDPDGLDRAAAAWRTGGRAGLEVLEECWAPSEQETARARTALLAAWDEAEAGEPSPFTADGNRWTLTGRGLQLRQGRDGRWYPYRRTSGVWWPAGAPDTDPSSALAELLEPASPADPVGDA
ncbi:SWIM zinc finger family protein [Streptomyces sp. S186]|uniref:SWIM zinc finger family protein n=1 Tax=Streptomyces sp. S186 TaxID=3434395 RepID=UPI003F67896C